MFDLFRKKPDASELVEEARGLVGKGDIVGALAAFDRLVKAYPNLPNAFADRGTALAMAGRIKEAVVDLQKAIQLGYQHSTVYASLATAQAQLGNAGAAIASFGAAAALDPNNSLIYYNRAALLHSMGDNTGARKDLERCLQLGPDAKFEAAIRAKLGDLTGES
jgi:tetratricopeptide (TPR) repeat protein